MYMFLHVGDWRMSPEMALVEACIWHLFGVLSPSLRLVVTYCCKDMIQGLYQSSEDLCNIWMMVNPGCDPCDPQCVWTTCLCECKSLKQYEDGGDYLCRKNQFAVVENEGFWYWTFSLKDKHGGTLAEINRNWRGFGYEVTNLHSYFHCCQACDHHQAQIFLCFRRSLTICLFFFSLIHFEVMQEFSGCSFWQMLDSTRSDLVTYSQAIAISTLHRMKLSTLAGPFSQTPRNILVRRKCNNCKRQQSRWLHFFPLFSIHFSWYYARLQSVFIFNILVE